MANIVVYDSQYGNTEKITNAIAKVIPAVKVFKADSVNKSHLKNIKLLIVGSPTWGGRPTKAVQNFLNAISPNELEKVKVAAFDTRFSEKDLNFALKLLIKTIGFAAPKILKTLAGKGGEQIAAPEGFIVKGKEGPLADGELDRAALWAKQIIKKM